MTAHRTVRLVLSLLAGLLLAGTVATAQRPPPRPRTATASGATTSGATASGPSPRRAPTPSSRPTARVEGWRFAVGGAKPRVPRAAGDFEAICGKTPAETGKKRVALVVDPGTPEDAVAGDTPGEAKGTCVVTAPKSNGAQILAAAGPVRIEKGLTCGVAGYPSKSCGDQVKNIKVPATDAPVKLQIGAAVGSTGDTCCFHTRFGQQRYAVDRHHHRRRRGPPAGGRRVLPQPSAYCGELSARRTPPDTPPGTPPGGLVVVGALYGCRGQQDTQPGPAGPDPRRHRIRRFRPPERRAVGTQLRCVPQARPGGHRCPRSPAGAAVHSLAGEHAAVHAAADPVA